MWHARHAKQVNRGNTIAMENEKHGIAKVGTAPAVLRKAKQRRAQKTPALSAKCAPYC